MLVRGQRLGVAVSGGADSVCLLHLLKEFAASLDVRLHVLHLNHNLRGLESAKDAEFVQKLADSLQLPSTIGSAQVRSAKGNLEQAGRQARAGFFRNSIQSGAVDVVATGHTQSDQAETVLFRLLRGTGVSGLSGIRPVLRLPGGTAWLIRPLLGFTRAEILEELRNREAVWREDDSNTSVSFTRNRIRHQLLPELARDYNPRAASVLSSFAKIAQDENDYWDQQVEHHGSVLSPLTSGAILLDTTELLERPRALQRHLVRRAVEKVKGDLRAIGLDHVEAILDLAERTQGCGRVQIPSVEAVRSFDQIRLAKPRDHSQIGSGSVSLQIPGHTHYSGFVIAAHTRIPEKVCERRSDCDRRVYTLDSGELDYDKIQFPLELRNWGPGDSFSGPDRSRRKIKLLFQKSKIPIWDRDAWPVLVQGSEVIWTRRFGAAGHYRPTEGTLRILCVREVADTAQG